MRLIIINMMSTSMLIFMYTFKYIVQMPILVCLIYNYNKHTPMWDQSDDQSYYDSQSIEHQPAPITPPHLNGHLHNILQVNVAIYRDILGLEVSPDSFRLQADQEESFSQQYSQSDHDYDYQDDIDDHRAPNYEEDQAFAQLYRHQESVSESQVEQYFSDDSFGAVYSQQSASSYSSNQSPFFPQKQGMEDHEIEALPTMIWNKTHDLFNKGEKCPICLQDFQVGHRLRVMNCLHRFHCSCLDQWLTVKASCPSCRNCPH